MERFDSILNQTFVNWELIVVDGYSDDGSWELIKEFAAKDPRIHISQSQSERQGIYPSLNECLSKARGEYIYIATGDDTMTPGCLEKMLQALESHPDCDLCHCCLKLIDENGLPNQEKWEDFLCQRFLGNIIFQKHIRKAPYDGILHLGLHSVYTSLTQLLIKKRVFDKVGLFRNDWGSVGDFEWNMRASLVCDTLHLPEYLATWRLHKNQATEKFEAKFTELEKCEKKIAMTKEAIKILEKYDMKMYAKLNTGNLFEIYKVEKFYLILNKMRSILPKLIICAKSCLKDHRLIACLLWFKLTGTSPRDGMTKILRKELSRLGLNKNIILL